MGIGGAGTLGGAGPGSSNSGWNSAGSGVAGTGIGDRGRATAGSTATLNPGCALEESGNMAITSCMQAAGKRRMLRA
uniref:Uncharacterized protein n=1 Tax=Tetradesmus obliquus TaxID=3088 RepID=A0A383VQF7_TETOB|eukprot:jgi/Sobl393_1/9166/SZX67079.1